MRSPKTFAKRFFQSILFDELSLPRYQDTMQGLTNESVGEFFQVDLLRTARDKTLEIILEVARQMKMGMSEQNAKDLIQAVQTQKGAPKSWHPPQIRFAENTLLSFGKKGLSENVVLKENDIFFFDIGPIFENHEGDVGRTFSIGNDPEIAKCCRDVEEIWHQVREHWRSTGSTGAELYAFAETCARSSGWLLSLEKANGHRIADFPHIARLRGSIEEFDQKPAPNRWILEIQIRHATRSFGAFYEDLLN
jgi:Xaa-Pro aminopeptidase